MKTNLKNYLPLLILLFAVTLSFSQSKANGLQDLVGAKGSSAEYELENRGYKHIKTEKSNYDVYSYWWNSQHKKCVSYRLNDGRIKSIVNTPPADCNKTNNSNYNSSYNDLRNERNHGSHVNVNDLVGWGAIDAYEELMSRGFDKRKKETYGSKTYGVWYNRDTHQCIKTLSENKKISSIVKSTHCFN